jgi:hypothetical protein
VKGAGRPFPDIESGAPGGRQVAHVTSMLRRNRGKKTAAPGDGLGSGATKSDCLRQFIDASRRTLRPGFIAGSPLGCAV